MSIDITFNLSEEDIQHFATLAREAQENVHSVEDAGKVAAAASELLAKSAESSPPEFIQSRLVRLQQLVDMVEDDEWALPEEDLERVVRAMAYFADPEDLIADRIPGIGFLDDAIMVELVVRDLEHEIAAYSEFCTFRSAEESRLAGQGKDVKIGRDDWLADKRAVLHSRMRERRRERASSGAWKVRLW
ncbi:MAG: YkvA family protein [Gammaproteobacteria bacterium]